MKNADIPIVGIHGAPRSGTSWLGQVFNSQPHVAYRYQPFFSYAFRGRIDLNSNAEDVGRCFADLLSTKDEFVTQTGAARLARNEPEFQKLEPTCLVYKEVRFHHLIEHIMKLAPKTRFVGIVRDPRAVLASWFAAPREFTPGWSPEAEWREARKKNLDLEENWYGYIRWKQLAALFVDLSSRHADRFRLVRYEDLVASPASTIKALFQFCELPCTEQTLDFIEKSTTQDDGDTYGVYRHHGKPLASRPLPSDIAAEIERDLAETALERFLA